MSGLAWTSTMPTEPGYYLVCYRGYHTKRRHIDCVKLSYPPERYGWKDSHLSLAIEEDQRRVGHTKGWQPIQFHPDCGEVLWSEPIQLPNEAVSK